MHTKHRLNNILLDCTIMNSHSKQCKFFLIFMPLCQIVINTNFDDFFLRTLSHTLKSELNWSVLTFRDQGLATTSVKLLSQDHIYCYRNLQDTQFACTQFSRLRLFVPKLCHSYKTLLGAQWISMKSLALSKLLVKL